MGAILAARRLVYEYPGPIRAVDGVDLELEQGELCLLIGPNGSGKSTLLRLLGGALEPAAGDVLLAGCPLLDLSLRERARRIAVVPQFLPTLFEVRVRDFVGGGRYAHRGFLGRGGRRDGEIVRASLEVADAADLEARLLSELSGGQRQRVLVARALAQEAELLLFDEPTASLDPDHQVRLFELIVRLVESGRSAVVVTHELNLAGRYATRLVLLNGGRVRRTGPAREVLRREVLEPVYGGNLLYGEAPGGGGGGARPLVVPWPASGR